MGTHDMTTAGQLQCFKCGCVHDGYECLPFGQSIRYPLTPVLDTDPVLSELRAIRALLERLVAK